MIFAASLWQANDAAAQTIDPAFADEYSIANLGMVPGLPGPYGPLVFKAGDDNTILIGGATGTDDAAIFEIAVERDADGNITGFTGTATLRAAADGTGGGNSLDGGLAYGPDNVLFYTTYQDNRCGQIRPGSTSNDRLIDLTPLGVASSVGALGFVPSGFGGAGRIKFLSYTTGQWYDAAVSADGSGTFNIVGLTGKAALLDNGVEGFAYLKAGQPLFSADSLILAEYFTSKIVTYVVDANGDPTEDSRTVFADMGIVGPMGCAFDPVTGALLISNFNSNTVSQIKGFLPPDQVGMACGTCGAGTAMMMPVMLIGMGLMRQPRRKIRR